jgi:hypothetical protein
MESPGSRRWVRKVSLAGLQVSQAGGVRPGATSLAVVHKSRPPPARLARPGAVVSRLRRRPEVPEALIPPDADWDSQPISSEQSGELTFVDIDEFLATF